MEEKIEERKSKADNAEEFFTEDEYEVASALLCLQNIERLNEESASTSESPNDEFLRQIKGKDKQEDHQQVSNGSSAAIPKRIYAGPPLPSYLAEAIDDWCIPFHKTLTETDLKDNQTRLSLHKNHVEQWFVPELKEHEDVNKGIWVTTYDYKGQGYPMKFVFWSSKMYVLTTTGWKQFYKEHGLKATQNVTVWMFRKVSEELCFAITWEASQ